MADSEHLPGLQVNADVMNDPAFQTNVKGKEKSMDEQDTCRICRGEGSKQEPLFYPCKCSGSIKFVHQDCLMEWLSHSQKKHCELCKTPFRFTKLYHPQMPKTVPLPVFLHQAAVHTFKSFLTWSRFHLVVFVWLGWLPWCMRTVWRGLFWIGDGGWIDWQAVQNRSLIHAQRRLERLAVDGTTPAHHGLLSSHGSSALDFVSRVSAALPPILSPASQTLNSTAGETTFTKVAKRLFQLMLAQNPNPSTPNNASALLNTTTVTRIAQRSPSWLSEVKLLQNLTRSSTLNNIIIDTLEGQLITISVVVGFILIFLIREWVVQQQPGINMGAGFNAGVVAEQQAEEVPVLQQLARQHADRRLDQARQDARNNGILPAEPERLPQVIDSRGDGQPVPLPLTERTVDGHQQDSDNVPGAQTVDTTSPQLEPSTISETAYPQSLVDVGPSNLTQRPGMPTRDALTRATEIQRTIEEHSRASGQDWPGLEVFMDMWKRANSQPSEVLRIIESEGRSEELGWIVAAMRRLELSSTDRPAQLIPDHTDRQPREDSAHEQQSDASSESWQMISGVSNQTHEPSLTASHPLSSGKTVDETNSLGLNRSTDIATSASSSHPDGIQISSRLAETESSRSSTPSEKSNDHSVVPRQPTSSSSPELNIFSYNVQPQMGFDIDDSSPEDDDHRSDAETLPSQRQVFTADGALREEKPGQSDESLFIAANSSPPQNQNSSPPEALDEGHSVQPRNESDPVQQDTLNTTLASQGLGDRITDWLWGDVTPPTGRVEEHGGDDEHIVHDVADEAPFVPVAHGQPVVEGGNVPEHPIHDPEVVRAAAEAGIDPNDPEAVEDGEDLEGVMELVGMQGPLAGLVQNGMFSAVLISMTVFFGIWVPYIAGKLFLVFLANPVSFILKLPLSWASTTADLAIDTTVFVAGCAFFWVDTVIRLACTPVGWLVPFIARMNENKILAETAKTYAQSALERLAKMFVTTGDTLSESEIPVFSIIAHEYLRTLEQNFAKVTESFVNSATTFARGSPAEIFDFENGSRHFAICLAAYTKSLCTSMAAKIHYSIAVAPSLLKVNPLRVNLDIPQRTADLDYSLAYWDSQDRAIAIILGYLFIFLIGAVYLKIVASFRATQDGEKVESPAADLLYQAGGVMKVVLIISIEMIVFPLYCGLLLDAALLPLFESASAASRFNFTLTSPFTSLFVHWFVGTCYMFHFALFVSMCRKIMRSGVLYFIRDPDDPTFHPVRDVLERNVTTQLRKIAFSALVYGALVIVCLGSVVWGLTFAFNGVFPIHWSSNEPVLEFPVDLLFYNFLMPVAVKFFKPSKGLSKMYDWWFRRCARALRLSNFLFGEKKEDEEGRHMRRTWWDLFSGKNGNAEQPVIGSDEPALVEDHNTSAYFVRNGKYVRAPASDQVRIPKGAHTFVELDEAGERADGLPDTDTGLHGRQNKMFAKIYIPPFFRLRICAFIFLIWLFAATTGVGMTIVPLVFGRFVFARLIPSHLRMNDIYAFSIGIYTLGGPLYLTLQYRTTLASYSQYLRPSHSSTLFQVMHRLLTYTIHALRLVYFYSTFTLLLPSLFALIMEAYLVIPLHTYFGGGTNERHVIHFIQDWTLGVLYVKMAGRMILWNENSRPAMALRAIVRDGWLSPDIRLATRSFVFPGTVLMVVALILPLQLAWLVNQVSWFEEANREVMRAVVYRYSYPAVLAVGMAGVFLILVERAVKGWRQRIRDEVYLIGERLHNFGEKRVVVPAGGGVTGNRVR